MGLFSSILKFTPNKGCSYPIILLSLIISQLCITLAVVIHLAVQWNTILPRDPTTSNVLLPFFVASAGLLFVVNTILLYLHYKGKLTPDYAALICLLLSAGFHITCIYIGYRPAKERKNELRGFFDPIGGGVMVFGLVVNIGVTTLWFVGRRIREENYRKSLLEIQRQSQMAAGANEAGLGTNGISPEHLAALAALPDRHLFKNKEYNINVTDKDLGTDSELTSPVSPISPMSDVSVDDIDIEKNLNLERAMQGRTLTTIITSGGNEPRVTREGVRLSFSVQGKK